MDSMKLHLRGNMQALCAAASTPRSAAASTPRTANIVPPPPANTVTPPPKRQKVVAPRPTADGDGGTPSLHLEHKSARCKSKTELKLAKLWHDGILCDVDIMVGGETFQAHRVVLAAGSDFLFERICQVGRLKNRTDNNRKIEIEDITATSFGIVLEWLYQGRCDVPETEVMYLFDAACRLQCADLVSTLEETISELINANTWIGAWESADRMRFAKLAEEAEAKVLEFYEELTGTEEFNALPAAKLKRLLASNQLNMENEEAVFTSVVKWAKAQSPPPTEEELGEIFEHVRFPLMSEEFIRTHVETETLVSENLRIMKALYHGMKERVFQEKTERTTIRQGAQLQMKEMKMKPPGLTVRIKEPLKMEEIEPGMTVRIKDDIEFVKTVLEDTAGWNDYMEEHIGCKYVIKNYDDTDQTVYLKKTKSWWPVEALERL